MRDIKFRAWNKDLGMFYIDENSDYTLEFGNVRPYLNIFCSDGKIDGFSVEHLMQYIGTEDKNGNEIYEGDFATLSVLDEPERGKGKYWVDEVFTVTYTTQCFLPFRLNESKVIGNVYENPDLLTTQGS